VRVYAFTPPALLRREVAEMMSEAEIALAQREARAWMTAH
jgi:hypothetical protein